MPCFFFSGASDGADEDPSAGGPLGVSSVFFSIFRVYFYFSFSRTFSLLGFSFFPSLVFTEFFFSSSLSQQSERVMKENRIRLARRSIILIHRSYVTARTERSTDILFIFFSQEKRCSFFFPFLTREKKRLVRYENFALYGLVVIATEAFVFISHQKLTSLRPSNSVV